MDMGDMDGGRCVAGHACGAAERQPAGCAAGRRADVQVSNYYFFIIVNCLDFPSLPQEFLVPRSLRKVPWPCLEGGGA